MIDLRVYRGTFILTLFAVVFAMFSLQSPPEPKSAALSPDSFDGARAARVAERISNSFPAPAAGFSDDRRLGNYVAERLAAYGYKVTRQSFKGRAAGKRRRLENVVGTLSGRSDQRVVVMAHRDASNSGAKAASATATAGLLEIANTIAKTAHRKTVEIVSSDGASVGALGAREFAKKSDRELIDAVLVVDDIGQIKPRQPYLIPWSANSTSASVQLIRTVRRSLKVEADRSTADVGPAGQFVRLALPLTAREQGVLLASGVQAVTVTSFGELPRGVSSSKATVSASTLTGFGQAALESYLTLDNIDRLEASPSQYLLVAGRVLPGWVIRVVVFALLLPVLAAAIDAFARARRRRFAVASWTVWVLTAAVPFLAALLIGHLLAFFGALPDLPSGFFSIDPEPIDSGAVFAWSSIVLVIVAMILLRHRRAQRFKQAAGSAAAPGAAVAVGLVLALEILVVWLLNPFAAAVLLPAAHFWLLVVQPDNRSSIALMLSLLLAGLILPVLVVYYYALAFNLSWDIVYQLVLVFSGNALSPVQGVTLSLMTGTFLAVSSICIARRN